MIKKRTTATVDLIEELHRIALELPIDKDTQMIQAAAARLEEIVEAEVASAQKRD
jgi:hypothetical protein